jgi:hypothetical protein
VSAPEQDAPTGPRGTAGPDAPLREPTADSPIRGTSQADTVNEELQVENAETALDQPSDGSGGE